MYNLYEYIIHTHECLYIDTEIKKSKIKAFIKNSKLFQVTKEQFSSPNMFARQENTTAFIYSLIDKYVYIYIHRIYLYTLTRVNLVTCANINI